MSGFVSLAGGGLFGGKGRLEAAIFNGVSDFLYAPSLTGQVNGTQLLFSVAYRQGTGQVTELFHADNSSMPSGDTTTQTRILSPGNSGLEFKWRGEDGVGYGGQLSAVTPQNDWCFLLVALNTAGVSRYIHWGGSLGNFASGIVPNMPTDGRDLDFTPLGGWFICSRDGDPRPFDGAVAEMVIAPNQWLDITQASNREKFVKPNGTIVKHGGNGSSVTGVAPLMYFSGSGNTFATNRGSGGVFTRNGSLEPFIGDVRIDP